MQTLTAAVRSLATCAWLLAVFGFVSLPDDAPLWRGSPAGLALFALLLVAGFVLYEAHRTPTRLAATQHPDSMADQAPRIRRSAAYRNRCYPPVKYVYTPSRDW